jgi:hypothetical protein
MWPFLDRLAIEVIPPLAVKGSPIDENFNR